MAIGKSTMIIVLFAFERNHFLLVGTTGTTRLAELTMEKRVSTLPGTTYSMYYILLYTYLPVHIITSQYDYASNNYHKTN